MKKLLIMGSVAVGAASLAVLAYKERKSLSKLLQRKDTFRFPKWNPDVTPISFANENTRFGGLE